MDLDPQVVGVYGTPGRYGGDGAHGGALDAAVSGNYAYLAEQPRELFPGSAGGGLQVIDISNPAIPLRVGGYEAGNHAYGVAVSGNYAYVVMSGRLQGTNHVAAGLHVLDISNPCSPQPTGCYDIHGWPLSTNYTYTREGTSGWEVIDVSDPANPRRVGPYHTIASVYGVTVKGDYAYTPEGVLDITNPANPQWLSRFPTNGDAIAISGHYAYVSSVTSRYGQLPDCDGCGDGDVFACVLQVYDIRDAASPRYLTSFECKGDYSDWVNVAVDVAVTGHYAYLAGPRGLHVFDISDPAQLQLVGEIIASNVQGVAISEGYAYVPEAFWTDCGGGTLDDPDDLPPPPPPCYDLVGGGLTVIALGKLANPQRVVSYETGGRLSAMEVSGNYAYAVGDYGLEVIEVADLRNVQRRAIYDGSFECVAVSGNYAFVTTDPIWNGTNYSPGSLLVFDVSAPVKPQRVGAYNQSVEWSYDLAVLGNYAYLTTASLWNGTNYVGGGLHVLDVSDPTNPQRVGRYGDGFDFDALAVSGNYALVVGRGRWNGTDYFGRGLHVIDISDPCNPQRAGAFASDYGLNAIAVFGNYACVVGSGRWGRGLHVIDISDPANPHGVGAWDTAADPLDVTVRGRFAYVLTGHEFDGLNRLTSLHVIDVGNPANPQRVGGNPNVDGFGAAVTLANGKVFVAAGAQGLTILHEYQPIRFEQIARQENGAMHLRIAGPPRVPGRLQRSADLRTWTDWLPMNFGESPLDISDPDAASAGAGFYRLAVP